MQHHSDDTCPVCATADIICGKWTILVIRDLADGRTRFCELERSLAGISPRTLSLRLRALEEQGIVEAHLPGGASARGVLAHGQGPRAPAADRGHAPLRARVAGSVRERQPARARRSGGLTQEHARSRRIRAYAESRLHDALKEFALEAAALLTEELRSGAEIGFDVEEDGGRNGPALYRYRPLTERFIADRWPALRELPLCAGGRRPRRRRSAWLRVNGFGANGRSPRSRPCWPACTRTPPASASPRSASSASTPRSRRPLPRHRARQRPSPCTAFMDADRVDLGDGFSLVRAARLDAPLDPDGVACVFERDVAPGDDGPGRTPRVAAASW